MNKYEKMKIAGIIIDETITVPIAILKNELTGTVFPIKLSKKDHKEIVYMISENNENTTSLLKKMIKGCGFDVERITLDMNVKKDVVAKIKIDKGVTLPPSVIEMTVVEAISAAIIFNMQIDVSAKLIKEASFFKTKVTDEELLKMEFGGFFATSMPPKELGDFLRKKKETVQ